MNANEQANVLASEVDKLSSEIGTLYEHVSAVKAIHKILDGVEWDAETIELVAEVINSLEGYEIRGPDDEFGYHKDHDIRGEVVGTTAVTFKVINGELDVFWEGQDIAIPEIKNAFCYTCGEPLITN